MGYAEDPLMPSRHRFPMAAAVMEISEELPSSLRPFVLRGAQTVTPQESKHRTPSHQTLHPEKTHLDDRVDDDSWYTPDD